MAVIQVVLMFIWYVMTNKTTQGSQNSVFTIDAQFDWHSVPKDPLLVDWSQLRKGKQLVKDIDWMAVDRKPRPSQLHDKWVVITSINKPTSDVKMLAKMDGWKVVVVGDTKTPPDWRYCVIHSCIYLFIILRYCLIILDLQLYKFVQKQSNELPINYYIVQCNDTCINCQ